MKLTLYKTRLILYLSVLAAVTLEIFFVRPNLASGHLAQAEEVIVFAFAPIAVALYTSIVLLRHEVSSKRGRFKKGD